MTVDYTSAPDLQSAIAQGPVKIAIDADALPSGAGNQSGWYALQHGNWRNTDHCVGLSGYGSAAFLYNALKIPLPAKVSAQTPGFLLFTWDTLGFVTHAWLTGTCVQALWRKPTTPGLSPGPPPPPSAATITLSQDLVAGVYTIGKPPGLGLTPEQWQQLIQLVLALLMQFLQKKS